MYKKDYPKDPFTSLMIDVAIIIAFIVVAGITSVQQVTMNEEIIGKEIALFNSRIKLYAIIMGISLFTLFISISLHKKPKPDLPNKDLDRVLSPLLAETIIDGKIGVREFILTTLIHAAARDIVEIDREGNLKLDLEKYNALPQDIEKSTLKVIFLSGESTTFKELNTRMATENSFHDGFVDVKRDIIRELKARKIYSKPVFVFSQLLSLVSALILLYIPAFFLEYDDIATGSMLVALPICTFFIILIYLKNIFTVSLFSDRKAVRTRISPLYNFAELIYVFAGIFLMGMFFAYFSLITTVFMGIWRINILFLAFVAINIFVLVLNARIPFTRKGKYERKKILELKKYLNQYSLIKDRDVDAEVIWDDYLAYAVAFEIPNKISKRIYKDLTYNMNAKFKIIDNFF